MSLYWKFIGFGFFLVLFTSVFLYYFANQKAEEVLKKQVLADLSQQSVNSMRSIERFLYERISDIKSLSNNPLFKDSTTTQETRHQYFKRIHQLNQLYFSFSFFDLNRVRKADSKDLLLNTQHPLDIYWKDIAQGKELVIDISRSYSSGEIVIHFAAVVKDFQNKPCGVIVSRVLVEKLYEVFQEIPYSLRLKDKIMIDLVDKQGVLLYSNHQRKKILKKFYKPIFPENAHNTLKYHLIEENKQLSFYIKQQPYLDYKGNDWLLILSMPTQQAYASLIEISETLLAVFWVIVVLGSCLSLLFALFFARPIIKLANAAKAIGEGNWEADTKINTQDELQLLSKELYKMGQKLKKKIEEQQAQNIHIQQQSQQIEKQNQALEEAFINLEDKNIRLTESIGYAKKIQTAMLPEESLLKQLFEHFFILYKPKDIVSGDFYWFDIVENHQKKYFIIAAADCTGHGVPGAILAMLGSNILSNIISYQKNIDTATILQNVNHYIQEELNQSNTQDATSYDGMEIALCVIDLETLSMQFSGGGRPIYIVRQQELLEIKGDKVSIGGLDLVDKKNKFNITTHHFDLQTGDVLYLFSDGFKDQFGSDNNTRIDSRYFKQFLQEISHKTLLEQKEVIENYFLQWKGKNEQTDDVLLIGLKIDKTTLQHFTHQTEQQAYHSLAEFSITA